MKKTLFLLLLIMPYIGKSQSFKMDSLIKENNILSYNIIESNVIIEKQLSRSIYQVLVNDAPLDSTGMRLGDLPFVYNNKIYFNAMYAKKDDGYKHYTYSILNGQVDAFDLYFRYDDGLTCAYNIDRRNAKIYQVNPETGKQTLFADFWDTVKKVIYEIDNKEGSEEYFEQIFFINKNSAFVSFCYNDGSHGDGCTEMRYFLAKAPNSIAEITKKIHPKTDAGDRLSRCDSHIEFVTNDGKYIKEACKYDIYNYEKRTSRYNEKVSRLFDSDFNCLGDLLRMDSRSANGVNMQNGKVQNYFLISTTNEKDSTQRIWGNYVNKLVIIPYKFNPYLELAMYKAYNNELLTRKDIEGLEKYELGILRNLIFAKYNYAFSSEFYQAYFNLYEFYGNEQTQKTRIKDVNAKLTETDKATINMLKEIEAKKQ